MEAVTSITTEVPRDEQLDLERKSSRTSDFVEVGQNIRSRPKKHIGGGSRSHGEQSGLVDKPTRGGSQYNYTNREKLRELKEPPFEDTELQKDSTAVESNISSITFEPADAEQIEIMNDLNNPSEVISEQTPDLTAGEARKLKTEAAREKYFGLNRKDH